jgi:hypothetical protein
MTQRLQFESDGKVITVEVRGLRSDKALKGAYDNLVFIDHDVDYDLAFVTMGGDPSTAYLLNYLWNSEEVAGETWDVCSRDDEFSLVIRGERIWVRLGSTDARVILSMITTSDMRSAIAIRGKGFTIDQRIAMLEDVSQYYLGEFLALYTNADLLPARRLELESRLDAQNMGSLAQHGGHYDFRRRPDEFLRVLLASNDFNRAVCLINTYHLMSREQMRVLLDVMTDEYNICYVLTHATQGLSAGDVLEYAERIKDPGLLRQVGMAATALSPSQRRELMGEES